VNLLEIHSQEADNGFAGHCSFGCGDYNPGSGWNRCRGLLFYVSIIRDPLTHVNIDFPVGVTYNGGVSKKKLPPEVLEYFVRMGRKGGAIGGHARAAKMTKEELSESARKAVQSRWAKVRETQSK
jgi:hypothetical protein